LSLFLALDEVGEATGAACPTFDRTLVKSHYAPATRAFAVLEFNC